ncbi:MAG: type II toxin-antitoxin system RelE/ParE family toxin [Nanoarchaeota archaeon]|nr:type II toxin-antitoxin system RelE/ParE family toxin [Nanoarchaeota archaeon]
MYQIELRRAAYKDLKNIPADYARLITKHIDSLELNPRPPDSIKLKGDAGYSLRIGTYRILYDMGAFQMRLHALRGTLKDENTGYFQVSYTRTSRRLD